MKNIEKIILLGLLAGCGSSEPSRRHDGWFKRPNEDFHSEENKIKWYHEVTKSGYYLTCYFLDEKECIEFIDDNEDGECNFNYIDVDSPNHLSSACLADLIDCNDPPPKGMKLYLVRALHMFGGEFGVYLEGNKLWVLKDSMGGFYPEERTALVIALPYMPTEVYVSVSVFW